MPIPRLHWIAGSLAAPFDLSKRLLAIMRFGPATRNREIDSSTPRQDYRWKREIRHFLGKISTVFLVAGALAFYAPLAYGQRYSPAAVRDSQEDQFIELIGLQSDSVKKLALIEQFTERYPGHPAVSWAYEQLQEAAFHAGQWDKALAFGAKLAQLNPEDIDAAQMNFKAAEAKGDRAQAKLWSDNVSRIAQRVLVSPPPKDADELEGWNKRIAIASQYAAQDEYALYKKALEAGDPKQQIKLLDQLLARNPSTAYLPQALVGYLNAYRALGDTKNALLTAEAILKSDRDNEDALLISAQACLQRGSNPDTVLAYSTRILDLMRTKKKPGSVRQEDWDKKRIIYSGTAYWMAGNIHVKQNQFAQADTALRAALPLLTESGQPVASVLFYLGWVNYKLEHFGEASRFFQHCMSIDSEFREQAAKNLNVMRSEHRLQD